MRTFHIIGPGLIDTISQLGDDIGGAEWNVGLGLIHLNASQDTVALALYAHNVLGSALTSFLLGNEPDLYLGGGKRPGMANYTIQNYVRHNMNLASNVIVGAHSGAIQISDYSEILNQMHAVPDLAQAPMAGPTICCGTW